MSTERRDAESAEDRLDQLFAQVFAVDSAPMLDYVALKFELKRSRSALKEARERLFDIAVKSNEPEIQQFAEAAYQRLAIAVPAPQAVSLGATE